MAKSSHFVKDKKIAKIFYLFFELQFFFASFIKSNPTSVNILSYSKYVMVNIN